MSAIKKSHAAVRAASLLGSVALTLPVAASAVPAADAIAPGTHTYSTAFTPRYFGAGEYAGVLRLRVNPDGSIVGYYRNFDVGDFRDVTGGVRGKNVWLDLGPGPSGEPIQATVENGKIVGGIYERGQPYSFVATPNDAAGLAGSP